MTEIAITAEGLGKQYTLGAARQQFTTLREQIVAQVRNPFARRAAQPAPETIWALRDVSFTIRQGEVVGLIGYNGAGKSTLLKVLSRIVEPTKGRAELHGRIGSLLEVGSGFHPELTGRENTFLNGAILGMSRNEISRKFDEIVAFAEIEKFIDTPVKFYSSGMYMRLAFAVAAHLEPEILIVDEVLAVGDARFQKKCLNKMEDVGHQGRTVIFVSHTMSAITRLCSRAIMLTQGTVVADGPAADVVSAYLNSGLGISAQKVWENPAEAPGDAIGRLRAVRVRDDRGRVTDAIDIRRPMTVEMEYEVLQPGYVLMPHFHFANEEGVRIFTTLDQDSEWRDQPRPVGRYVSAVKIPGNLLSEGTHFVHTNLMSLNPSQLQFSEPDVVAFQVYDSNDGDSARGSWAGRLGGAVRPLMPWTTVVQSEQLMAIEV